MEQGRVCSPCRRCQLPIVIAIFICCEPQQLFKPCVLSFLYCFKPYRVSQVKWDDPLLHQVWQGVQGLRTFYYSSNAYPAYWGLRKGETHECLGQSLSHLFWWLELKFAKNRFYLLHYEVLDLKKKNHPLLAEFVGLVSADDLQKKSRKKVSRQSRQEDDNEKLNSLTVCLAHLYSTGLKQTWLFSWHLHISSGYPF